MERKPQREVNRHGAEDVELVERKGQGVMNMGPKTLDAAMLIS